jgi:hypothetical protein
MLLLRLAALCIKAHENEKGQQTGLVDGRSKQSYDFRKCKLPIFFGQLAEQRYPDAGKDISLAILSGTCLKEPLRDPGSPGIAKLLQSRLNIRHVHAETSPFSWISLSFRYGVKRSVLIVFVIIGAIGKSVKKNLRMMNGLMTFIIDTSPILFYDECNNQNNFPGGI